MKSFKNWIKIKKLFETDESSLSGEEKISSIENKTWEFTNIKHIGQVSDFTIKYYRKEPSNFTKAAQAAGFYARKNNIPFQIVSGNSYMNKVFLIADATKDEIGRTANSNKEVNIGIVLPNGKVYQTLAVKRN
jgi:hypothetical protein